MKIAITGASGGIGRVLMRTLCAAHELTGIVRTLPASNHQQEGADYVAFSDEMGLTTALSEADVVIHGALDSKARGKQFLAVNRAMNSKVLDLALAGRCKLYVYVSSQVVYSGALPERESGYREEDLLHPEGRIDDYSRLKIEGEKQTIEACKVAGIDYLILRPTVVMGPGMNWSTDIVDASKWVSFGLKNRTMNIIHVDDLCAQVETLIKRGVSNQIFNLGVENIPTETYFKEVGRRVGRRTIFAPRFVMEMFGALLPSTFWFFGRDVRIDNSKIEQATGLTFNRYISDYFIDDVLEKARASNNRDETSHKERPGIRGQGYYDWFNPGATTTSFSMAHHRGVVNLTDNVVRVKAGTNIQEILDFLAPHKLTFATLPEFSGMSAASCVTTQVHGSSLDYFTLLDLVDRFWVLNEAGEEVEVTRGDALWEQVAFPRGIDKDRYVDLLHRPIITQVSFRCVPDFQLENRISWQSDDMLEHWLDDGYEANYSTTIQWYPHRGQLMVYQINPIESGHAATSGFTPFRGLSYPFQRALLKLSLRGTNGLTGTAADILAPWKRVPFHALAEKLIKGRRGNWCDTEILVSLDDGKRLVQGLRTAIANGGLPIGRNSGVGLRFSRDQADGKTYVWAEVVSSKFAVGQAFARIAEEACIDGVDYHLGKHWPFLPSNQI